MPDHILSARWLTAAVILLLGLMVVANIRSAQKWRKLAEKSAAGFERCLVSWKAANDALAARR